MIVELIEHPENADALANVSAKACISESMPYMDIEDTEYKALRIALKSGHESVIEHCSFTFSIEGISRACSHQLVRHRLASYSQQSQRYVRLSPFGYVIPETVESKDYQRDNFEWAMKVIDKVYNQLIAYGVPEEDARYVLPNACMTNIVVTMNARELRHFFALRCCNRAQWEIRQLANIMLSLCKEVAPVIFEDAGPSCKVLGHCPEARPCGKVVFNGH